MVYFNGYEYAALDNASPTDLSTNGCQTRFSTLPSGWHLAEEWNPLGDSEQVCGSFNWGTSYMVDSNGQTIGTGSHYNPLDPCHPRGDLAYGCRNLSTQGNTYRASFCPARILVSRKSLTG